MNDQGQYPEKIRELYARKNLDLELAIRKGEYQYQKNINLEVEKNKIRQFNKEIESARFESVTLGANGKLEVKISNPIMSIPARHFGNFDFLEISELVGMESGERGIFNLILNIEGCKTFAFIIGNKAGNGNYLLEKFSSIGARFYIEKRYDFKGYCWIFGQS